MDGSLARELVPESIGGRGERESGLDLPVEKGLTEADQNQREREEDEVERDQVFHGHPLLCE